MARSNRDAHHERPAQDKRFRVPVTRSRHAVTARIALTVALCFATLTIVVVASGLRMTDADASGVTKQIHLRD
ncbi:MAG: hypothetical protein JJU21_06850 [Salinarimonas sp.]|nr:hypothetical protein [Salinarimonas sp.]